MKAIALSIAACLAVASFAQTSTKPMKKVEKTPTKIACAVMPTNQVDVAKATKKHMYSDYKGRRYFFCCSGCPAEFKANPAKYAKAASLPTPKVEKPKAKKS